MASSAAATSAGSNRSNSGSSSASSASTLPSVRICATRSRRSAAEGRADAVARRREGRKARSLLEHRRRGLDVRSVRGALEEITQRGRIPAQEDAAGLFCLAQKGVEDGRMLAGEERFGPGDDNRVRGLELEGGTADERSEVLDPAGGRLHTAC